MAKRFLVNKDTVHAWIKLYQETGNVQPKKPGTRKKSQLEEYQEVIKQMVKEHSDYTLAEYCEYCAEKTGVIISQSAMCRFLLKLNLTRKKKSLKASQAGTENNQQERVNYWEKIRDVPPENLIFLDEMGVLLGIMRDYGRSEKGERLYDKKPFYRGAKRTVIGAITKDKVIAFDIIDKSMKGEDFQQFLKKHLAPVLTDTSVVVMDKLRCHTMAGVQKIIEEKGAKVIYLSGYSPDFNPIEHLWWELKAFLRHFIPKSKEAVDALLRLAVEYLISSEQLSHYFAHCCYCPV